MKNNKIIVGAVSAMSALVTLGIIIALVSMTREDGIKTSNSNYNNYNNLLNKPEETMAADEETMSEESEETMPIEETVPDIDYNDMLAARTPILDDEYGLPSDLAVRRVLSKKTNECKYIFDSASDDDYLFDGAEHNMGWHRNVPQKVYDIYENWKQYDWYWDVENHSNFYYDVVPSIDEWQTDTNEFGEVDSHLLHYSIYFTDFTGISSEELAGYDELIVKELPGMTLPCVVILDDGASYVADYYGKIYRLY